MLNKTKDYTQGQQNRQARKCIVSTRRSIARRGRECAWGCRGGVSTIERQLREASPRRHLPAEMQTKQVSPVADLRGQHQGQRDRRARALSRTQSGRCSRTVRAPLKPEQREQDRRGEQMIWRGKSWPAHVTQDSAHASPSCVPVGP